jgi:hypothetical protein
MIRDINDLLAAARRRGDEDPQKEVSALHAIAVSCWERLSGRDKARVMKEFADMLRRYPYHPTEV